MAINQRELMNPWENFDIWQAGMFVGRKVSALRVQKAILS